MNLGVNGEPVMFCHAGCIYEEVLAALSLSTRDLRPSRRVVRRKRQRAKLPPPPPLENQDLPLMWHDRLMLGRDRQNSWST